MSELSRQKKTRENTAAVNTLSLLGLCGKMSEPRTADRNLNITAQRAQKEGRQLDLIRVNCMKWDWFP